LCRIFFLTSWFWRVIIFGMYAKVKTKPTQYPSRAVWTKIFSSRDIQNIFGLAKPTVEYWYTQGLLIPSIADVRGRGSRRRYSFHDVIIAGVITKLLRLRHPHGNIRDVAAAVRRQLDEKYQNYDPMFLAVAIQIEEGNPGEEPSGDCGVVPMDKIGESFDASGALMFTDKSTGKPVSPAGPVETIVIIKLAPIVSKIMRYSL